MFVPDGWSPRPTQLIAGCRWRFTVLGATLLPCFLGDGRADLTRIGPPLPELDMGVWMLTHSDLRRSARVRAFMDFVGGELTKHRRVIEGEETRGKALSRRCGLTSSRSAPRSF